MAITMSGATVDSSNREALLNSEVDKNVLGNKVNNPFAGPLLTSFVRSGTSGLAGVTSEFATAVSAAIDKYCQNIESILSKLEAIDSKSAFKGSQIDGALANFVEGVKSSALSYLSKLKAAEQQIVESVQKAYQRADEQKGKSKRNKRLFILHITFTPSFTFVYAALYRRFYMRLRTPRYIFDYIRVTSAPNLRNFSSSL